MLVLTRRPARERLDVFSEIILTRGDEVIRVRLVECFKTKARIGVLAGEEWNIRRADVLPVATADRRPVAP
jgi:sRNA-binding carbon storage regulator CsrA